MKTQRKVNEQNCLFTELFLFLHQHTCQAYARKTGYAQMGRFFFLKIEISQTINSIYSAGHSKETILAMGFMVNLFNNSQTI